MSNGLEKIASYFVTRARALFPLARWSAALWRGFRRMLRIVLLGAVLGLIVLLVAFLGLNLAFHTPFNVAYRALDPNSATCTNIQPSERTVLALHGNDENQVRGIRLQNVDADWDKALHCSIQTHDVPNYQPTTAEGNPVGALETLSYDLAFLEFREDGTPYVLCTDHEYAKGQCDGVSIDANDVSAGKRIGQLEALLDRLKKKEGLVQKNYVVAWVHGWRHNADIGDGNVQDLRVYAAHAARFVRDRCNWGDLRFCDMKVTAVYVGWRGARTNELQITSLLTSIISPLCGKTCPFLNGLNDALNVFLAAPTLFDRKPVSEAVAPSALTALQAVESAIGLEGAYRHDDLAPCEHIELKDKGCVSSQSRGDTPQARMIVFGHSLGGNLLATALKDEWAKLAERHRPGYPATGLAPAQTADFVPSPLGNLVVLVNPASEAAKWIEFQQVVWRRIVMANSENARWEDYLNSHIFFNDAQRPIVVSATAARDWPPGGLRATDCLAIKTAAEKPNATEAEQDRWKEVQGEGSRVEYDWATYDLFPAFRSDLRPLATSLDRYAEAAMRTPRTNCAPIEFKGVWPRALHYLGAAMRVAPFMNTDVDQTHSIGNLDPPRSAQTDLRGGYYFSGRPFGTTHELRGWDEGELADRDSPHTVAYSDVGTAAVRCPVASNWLSLARIAKIKSDPSGHGVFWDALMLDKEQRPALRFLHGFELAGLAAITRANDPFWNMRAFDNALARHDGYMLTSFICAMQQLVLDDVTTIPPVPAPVPKNQAGTP